MAEKISVVESVALHLKGIEQTKSIARVAAEVYRKNNKRVQGICTGKHCKGA